VLQSVYFLTTVIIDLTCSSKLSVNIVYTRRIRIL